MYELMLAEQLLLKAREKTENLQKSGKAKSSDIIRVYVNFLRALEGIFGEIDELSSAISALETLKSECDCEGGKLKNEIPPVVISPIILNLDGMF